MAHRRLLCRGSIEPSAVDASFLHIDRKVDIDNIILGVTNTETGLFSDPGKQSPEANAMTVHQVYLYLFLYRAPVIYSSNSGLAALQSILQIVEGLYEKAGSPSHRRPVSEQHTWYVGGSTHSAVWNTSACMHHYWEKRHQTRGNGEKKKFKPFAGRFSSSSPLLPNV